MAPSERSFQSTLCKSNLKNWASQKGTILLTLVEVVPMRHEMIWYLERNILAVMAKLNKKAIFLTSGPAWPVVHLATLISPAYWRTSMAKDKLSRLDGVEHEQVSKFRLPTVFITFQEL